MSVNHRSPLLTTLLQSYALATAQTQLDLQTTFDMTVPVDLRSIFVGWGPLPAVVATSDQSGHWNAAGQTRTVKLSDGNEAQERLTRYVSPHSFSYTVTPKTGLFSLLVSEARGQWWFIPAHRSGTEIWWRYEFHPKTVWLVPMVSILAAIWHAYMHRALKLLVVQLHEEQG